MSHSFYRFMSFILSTSLFSYNKTNEKHKFIKFIFGIELYMFRTVSLSIVRSLALCTQQWYMSYKLC